MPGLYSTAGWRTLRTRQLLKEPCCRFCRQQGVIAPALVVDHIEPHRGDRELFFDSENLQSLCKTCHDSLKQAAENGLGVVSGSRVDGLPLDALHPWHRETDE